MRILRFLCLLLVFPFISQAADCDSVGPSRSATGHFIFCIYLADTATATGARTTCTGQVLENVDEWYFFISEDTGATDLVIDIENFFETDDDVVVLGQLTDEVPEFRWTREGDGQIHKSLRANITTAAGPPTDLDVQVCFSRWD